MTSCQPSPRGGNRRTSCDLRLPRRTVWTPLVARRLDRLLLAGHHQSLVLRLDGVGGAVALHRCRALGTANHRLRVLHLHLTDVLLASVPRLVDVLVHLRTRSLRRLRIWGWPPWSGRYLPQAFWSPTACHPQNAASPRPRCSTMCGASTDYSIPSSAGRSSLFFFLSWHTITRCFPCGGTSRCVCVYVCLINHLLMSHSAGRRMAATTCRAPSATERPRAAAPSVTWASSTNRPPTLNTGGLPSASFDALSHLFGEPMPPRGCRHKTVPALPDQDHAEVYVADRPQPSTASCSGAVWHLMFQVCVFVFLRAYRSQSPLTTGTGLGDPR